MEWTHLSFILMVFWELFIYREISILKADKVGLSDKKIEIRFEILWRKIVIWWESWTQLGLYLLHTSFFLGWYSQVDWKKSPFVFLINKLRERLEKKEETM